MHPPARHAASLLALALVVCTLPLVARATARHTCPYTVLAPRSRLGGAPSTCAARVVASHAAQCPCLLHMSAAAKVGGGADGEVLDFLVMTKRAWVGVEELVAQGRAPEEVDRAVEVAAEPKYSELGVRVESKYKGALLTWEREHVAFVDSVDSYVVVVRGGGEQGRCRTGAFAVLATVVPPPGIATRDVMVQTLGPAVVSLEEEVEMTFRVSYVPEANMCGGLDVAAHGEYEASAYIRGPGVGEKRPSLTAGDAPSVGGKPQPGVAGGSDDGNGGGVDAKDDGGGNDGGGGGGGGGGDDVVASEEGAKGSGQSVENGESDGGEDDSGKGKQVGLVAAGVGAAAALVAVALSAMVVSRRRKAAASAGMSHGGEGGGGGEGVTPEGKVAVGGKMLVTEPLSGGESDFMCDDGEGAAACTPRTGSVGRYEPGALAEVLAGQGRVDAVAGSGSGSAAHQTGGARTNSGHVGGGGGGDGSAPGLRAFAARLFGGLIGVDGGGGGVMQSTSKELSDSLSTVSGDGSASMCDAPPSQGSWGAPSRTASNASYEPPVLVGIDVRNRPDISFDPPGSDDRSSGTRSSTSTSSATTTGGRNSQRAWRIWRRRPLPSAGSAASASTGPVSGVSDFTPASLDSFSDRSAGVDEALAGRHGNVGDGGGAGAAQTIDEGGFDQPGWMLPAPAPMWRQR